VLEKWNVGIVEQWVLKTERTDFFSSSQPITPVFHYSNVLAAARLLSSYMIDRLQKYFIENSGLQFTNHFLVRPLYDRMVIPLRVVERREKPEKQVQQPSPPTS
jgi:hypothetical protein